MKVRKTRTDWFWIVFKYENVPMFCFICDLLGHSDRFCSHLFDTLENEITRSDGAWMRAPLRRQTKIIGAKWLRNGRGEVDRSSGSEKSQGWNGEANFIPRN